MQTQINYKISLFEPFKVELKQQSRKKKIKIDWEQFKQAASTQQEMAEIERAMAAENSLFTTEEFLSFLERHFNVSN